MWQNRSIPICKRPLRRLCVQKSSIGTFNLQVFVNNLFNKEYVANGWTATDTFADGSSLNWIGYYPQAPRNYMARLTLSF